MTGGVQRSGITGSPWVAVLLRMCLVMLVYSLLRVLFWAQNTALFPQPPLVAFIGGMRFDMVAIAWLHLPWVIAVLLAPRPGRRMQGLQLVLFLLANVPALFFNTVDVGYYAFSLKRSTDDFLQILTKGGDTVNLAPAFARDYWYLVLAYFGCLAGLILGYQAIGRRQHDKPIHLPARLLFSATIIAFLALATRGGIQLIPLQVLDGARYGGPTYLPVVLNTPYTMLKSFGKPALQERTYMPAEEADRYWPVIHRFTTPPPPPGSARPAPFSERTDRPNVVVIILESFSAVYSGVLGGGDGYMPFLDSLMGHGLNFTRAYANGRRSIDGVPAILAGMPELMDEAFITSTYATRPFTSLAGLLAEEGYATSFYHGGRNGTMGFDGFTRSAGFQRYVGMNEYPNGGEDFDGNWGIRDRPFLQFWARELEAEKQPFLSAVFTLSSHHPYRLPPQEAERFAGGTQAIQPTLRYTDDALRQFFATARHMPWYANTLFIITADHTADLERTGTHGDRPIDYWVPLLFFSPKESQPWPAGMYGWNGLSSDTAERVTQHIDILPTVLQLIGYDSPFFSFGRSALDTAGLRSAIWSNNGIYCSTSRHLSIRFDGERMLALTPTDEARHQSAEELDLITQLQVVQLKAGIQQFNHHLLRGTLVAQPTAE